jgi:hypothetical protein
LLDLGEAHALPHGCTAGDLVAWAFAAVHVLSSQPEVTLRVPGKDADAFDSALAAVEQCMAARSGAVTSLLLTADSHAIISLKDFRNEG